MRNDSLRTLTPASRNRPAAHSNACWLIADPVGRPPKRSVRVSRSRTSGVSPRRAPTSRSAAESATGACAVSARGPRRAASARAARSVPG